MKRLFTTGGFLNSCRYAWQGVCFLWNTELSFRIHFVVGTLTIIAGFVLKISLLEWVAVAICIMSVMAAEAFNTAFEILADTVHPEKNEGIGKAKDISAGAVLLIAIAAFAAGGIIFFPKMWELGKTILKL